MATVGAASRLASAAVCSESAVTGLTFAGASGGKSVATTMRKRIDVATKPRNCHPFSVRLPVDLMEFLDRQATNSYKTRNAYITELVLREMQAVQGERAA